MSVELVAGCCYHHPQKSQPQLLLSSFRISNSPSIVKLNNWEFRRRRNRRRSSSSAVTTITPRRTQRFFYPISASLQELDLTEDNVKQVLSDARDKFSHIFDASVGMTGVAELAELDGPFVKISLKGRFWHERSLILARLGNYLKQRIPEILEVDIEDEKQLDDSPENF